MSGHRVTIFDRMDEASGLITYAIPAYRLPKDIVKRAIETIEKAGVTFKLNVDVGDVGKGVALSALQKDFDSLFLATGAWKQPSIGIEGEELTQSGLEFLTRVNRGKVSRGRGQGCSPARQ